MRRNEIKHILLSRTDSIGDVVLTLPMAGWIKQNMPGTKVSFLGKNYTRSVVSLSVNIDDFISYDELNQLPVSGKISLLQEKKIDCVIHVFPRSDISSLMKKASVKWRIGTKNRTYHWFHCNDLVSLSRIKSDLHESQLNFKLLKPFGLDKLPDLNEMQQWFGFKNIPELDQCFKEIISDGRKNIILHPKSKGSAREWGLENFNLLIDALPVEKYKIFISGTAEEGKWCESIFQRHPEVTDLTGKMSLDQFIAFINSVDGIVAASTGPLHIAAALGKKAVGLFSPMRPIHPGRWKPIGSHASALCLDKVCNDCVKSGDCSCVRAIKAQEVISAFESL